MGVGGEKQAEKPELRNPHKKKEKKNDGFQASLTSHFFIRYARLIVSKTFQPSRYIQEGMYRAG